MREEVNLVVAIVQKLLLDACRSRRLRIGYRAGVYCDRFEIEFVWR